MRKVLITAIAVVAIAVLAVPYYFGIQIEFNYKKTISQFSMPGSFELTVTSYDRGLFTSEAQLLLTFDIPPGTTGSDPEFARMTRFVFQDTVYHGPFTFAAGSFNGMPAPMFALAVVDSTFFFEEEPDVIAQLFGTPALSTSRMVVDSSGAIDGYMWGPELTTEAESPFSIKWSGFEGPFAYDNGHLTMEATGGGMEINSSQGSFKMLGWKSDMDMNRHPFGFFYGGSSGHMDGFFLTEEGTTMGGAYGIDFSLVSNMDGDLMDAKITTTLESVKVETEEFGPARLVYGMEKLDIPSYLRLIERFEDIFDELAMVAMSGGEDQSFVQTIGPDGVDAIDSLIKNSPSISISELTIETPQGLLEGSVLLGINGNTQYDLENPVTLITALYSEFDMSLPTELAKRMAKSSSEGQAYQQLFMENPDAMPDPSEVDKVAKKLADQQLKDIVDQGVFVKDRDRLRLDGSFSGGKLLLNGKEIPIPM